MAKRLQLTALDKKKLEAQLVCSQCQAYLKEPKLLPCFHAFCKSPCLENLVSKDGHSLTCPICKHIVQLSQKGVAGLQSDLIIERFFAIKKAYDEAPDLSKKQCENCEQDKATGYCDDCDELLCEICQASHRRSKKTRLHALQSLDKLNSLATKLIPTQNPLLKCAKRPENPLKIYCETCLEEICGKCTCTTQSGQDYKPMAEILQQHKQELVSSLKPVRNKLNKVQEALEAFDIQAEESKIRMQRANLEADIHKEINQLHKLLDQRRAALLEELEELTQQEIKNLPKQRNQLEMIKAKLRSCIEFAETCLIVGTEVLPERATLLSRIKEISAEFTPDSLKLEAELIPLGKQEQQQAIQDFLQLADSSTFSPRESKLELEGLRNLKAGLHQTVAYTAMNRNGLPLKRPLKMKAELSDREGKSFIKCEVTHEQNGKYRINYTPMRRGDKLHITVNENPIPGSPFKIAVLPTPQCFQQPTRLIPGLSKPGAVVFNSKGQIVMVESNGYAVKVLTTEGQTLCLFGSEGSGNGQLNYVYGVTVDKEDNIYIADTCNNRVQKFSSEGVFIKAVGSKGSNNLQFSNPTGVTYNYQDNLLYVADQYNHRIQVLTADLAFVRTFGQQGTRNGQFNCPAAIAFNSTNNMYVTDYRNNRVQVMTTTGEFLRSFSEKSDGWNINDPLTIAIDSSNSVYVSEEGRCVSVFSSQGDYITTVKSEICSYGISTDSNDVLIITDWNGDCLYQY